MAFYDVASKKADQLQITISRKQCFYPKKKTFDVRNNISAFDVSPDGKSFAFCVKRGELFVSDAEGKFIMEMQRGSAERVSEVKWLSDNKRCYLTRPWMAT